ncbi:hypothetical protein [Brevundimonas sp.]|uniref:hypothetical protein n=1 Tax=Brevundimonas sp. TaxID=1871086 RepID=UPI002488FC3A|nr:hypothetical protein [Brevundimonas sp.]MDI1280057.1 hypothetical protein [Brevundimonas sp.]
MAILLADSNALRSPNLVGYLSSSPENLIALSDLTLTEMLKKNALATARGSLRIVSLFPAQTLVLRPTHEILEERITRVADVPRLVDIPITDQVRALSQDIQSQPTGLGLTLRMAAMEQDHARRHALLTAEVEHMIAGLVDAAKDFRADEIVQLRTGRDVTDTTRGKLLELLKETVREFIVTNQQPDRRSPMTFGEAAKMFAFRYSLCVTIYYVIWVQSGRQTAQSLERRVNDVVDLQVAAMGTFFSGVVSDDQRLQRVSISARQVLRNWGAYVGSELRHAFPGTPEIQR